jgi:imidazolonepropionase-like amidohydrolase
VSSPPTSPPAAVDAQVPDSVVAAAQNTPARVWIQATDGSGRNYEAAKAMGVKIAFGTDMLFDPSAAAKQGIMVTKLQYWFTPYEALRMVTSNNAELLTLSGPRHPYQEGPLGVIAEGAYAGLILIDGNPPENLELVGDADKNFVVIMKDGVVYKNTRHQATGY